MKHTKKRLLALLLVMAMMLGMAPVAALMAGAETTDVVDPVLPDAVIGEDGAIADLGWSNGYVGSPTHSFGNQWKIVPTASDSSYRYSDVVNIPKAGTTLVWSESLAAGKMSNNAMLLTSWKMVEDEWVIDYNGANISAVVETVDNVQRPTNNSNQWYDGANNAVYYFYTTTKDNEALRFSCYGGLSDGAFAATAADCPKVYVYEPTFAEGENEGEGVIEGLWWNAGFVTSYTNDYYTPNAWICQGVAGTDYNCSAPIIVPKAGTTISFTESGSKFTSEQAYAFSTWTVNGSGALQLFYGLGGANSADPADSAWVTIGEDGSRTYFYTTAYDNEIIRITTRGTATPVISYKEDNAEECPAVLLAAGYDAEQKGTPYMVEWYNGLMSVEGESIVLGSPMYAFSDIIPVYGKGTTITFTDMVGDEEAGASNFAGDGVFVIAKFDGTGYTGVSGSASNAAFVSGVLAGDGADAREEALYEGKRVYTYTTTEDVEYLRIGVSTVGNELNGGVVMPLVYLTAPGAGAYYNELEGLKLVAIGDSYFFGGGADTDDTWVNRLGAKYGMQYYNYGINGSTVSSYVTTNNPMVNRYSKMVGDADIVIFEGGRNDYNQNVPLGEIGNTDPTTFLGAVQTVLAGLMEKNPNALIVCVTPWNLVDLDATGITSNKVNGAGLRTEDYANAFASYVESLNNDRVVAVRSCDDDVIPVFMTNAAFRKVYCVGANDISHLNALGHAHVLPWFEQLIGQAYQNFGGLVADGGENVKFMNGEAVVSQFGTVAGDRVIKVPVAPAGVDADNIFGWAGVLTTAEGTEYKIFRAGEAVTLKQGATGVFEPLTLEMKQVAKPELRLNDTVGLRFLASVSDAEYKALLTMIEAGELGDATVTVGMLIVPVEYVAEMNGELTHEAFEAAGKKKVEAISEITWNEDDTLNWYKTEGDYGFVAGTIHNFLQENHARSFTARGYVKLTLNGEDFYVYAQDGGRKGATIYDVAMQALNDCTPGPNDINQYKIEGESGVAYTQYAPEDRAALAKYVDDVLALNTVFDEELGCTGAELVHYDHYDPNSKRYHAITLVNGGNDSLSDIFYPYAGAANASAAVKDEAWELLIAALGNDADITSICAIVVEDGYEISAEGGILLDGYICELDEADATVKCTEFEYEGVVFYLLGFCDFGSDFY